MKHETSNWLGKRFGRLTVLEFSHTKEFQNKDRLRTRYYYRCRCDCGNESIVSVHCLGNPEDARKVKSCGCGHAEGIKRGHEKQRGSVRHSIRKSDAPLNWLFCTTRASARSRGIPFELDKQQIKDLTQRNCHYCGSGPSKVYKGSTKRNRTTEQDHFVGNGIDRLDSSRGYVTDNVVPCCEKCNKMKLHHTVPEFLAHVRKIYNYSMEESGV